MTCAVRAAIAASCAALLLSAAATAAPQKEKPPKRPSITKGAAIPPGTAPEMSAGRMEQVSPGEWLLTGDVDFRYGQARLLADALRYSDRDRTAVADGNVVIGFGRNQISGDHVEANLDTETAIIENARAYLDPDVTIQAERLEKIGEQTFRITRGTVTTCTQPTPYWSFYVSSAVITVGSYAHMRNASFRLGKVPAFWSPYLIWPVKEDRAAGLLIPSIGFTRKRGPYVSDAVYFPMGRSADATIQFDFYNGAVSGTTEQFPQAGQGLEMRFVPSAGGSGTLTAYYLRERFRPEPGADVVSRNRYHVSLAHTQRFTEGFKLLVDVNAVSDLDYFLDFEREIRYSTTPTVFSQVDLSRLSGPYALNVRLNRQVQFLGVDPASNRTEDLTLWRLPELELRGRGIRLGKSRFYLNFASSLDGFTRRSRTFDSFGQFETQQVTYTRFDLFPTISGNFTPVPWLDISPTIALRETYYTASDNDPGAELDTTGPAINREQLRAGISVLGPRFYHLYGSDAPDRTRYKHTIEPRVSYDWVPEVTGGEKVIPFDEIDTALPSSNVVTYSLTSRLFAKRPENADAALAAPPALTGSFASLVLGEEAPTRHEELVKPEAAVLGAPPVESAPPAETAPAPAAPPSEPAAPTETPETTAGEGTQAPPPPTVGETYTPSSVSTGTGLKSPFGPGAPRSLEAARLPSVGAFEIATFDLTQRYSLDTLGPLSRSTLLRSESAFSPVEATIRYNPTFSSSVDLRATYDILFHDIRSVSLSSNLRSRDLGYLRFSWFLNRDLEGTPTSANPQCALDPDRLGGRSGSDPGRCFDDSSQIRVLAGATVLNRKITADVEGSYDIVKSFLRDQRYRFGYNTQCCGVLLEIAKRSFLTAAEGATSSIEYRFVLNLRGVGTFLDLNGRPQ